MPPRPPTAICGPLPGLALGACSPSRPHHDSTPDSTGVQVVCYLGVLMRNRWPEADEATSFRMARVRPLDTAPELAVRRIVHGLGYRYRLDVHGLPGRPDIVLRRLRKVILVHGCYWHRHSCRRGRSTPLNNAGLWTAKFESTHKRDRANQQALRRAGWSVLVVWECQLTDLSTTVRRIRRFMSASSPSPKSSSTRFR